jgi:myo-inositol-1(or 4)-monophosphatase
VTLLTKRELTGLVDFCSELAVDAGKMLKRGFNSRLKIVYKGRINPVTDLDVKAERRITGEIKRRFPSHSILAEEGTGSGTRAEYRWIIDPLDGTVNYAHGFPVYCVSIAVEFRGTVVAGAVYDPERDELFKTSLGAGAFLNGKRIRVTLETNLERALLATGFAYDIGTSPRNNLGLFARMAKKAQGIRRPGSAAIDMCWLASGRIDGFWELKLHPWDTAAASLLVTEAGGKITRIDGSRYSIYDPDMLASNGHLHRIMRKVLTHR